MKLKFDIAASAISRFISYLVYLLLIPAYINYFDNDKVLAGLWFVVISTCNWILVLDLGIGNAMRNRLIKTRYRNNTKSSLNIIFSSYFINAIFATILFLLSFIIIYFYSENLSGYRNDIRNGILIVSLFICLQFFLRTVIFIQYAEQRAYLSSIFNLVTNLIIFAYISVGFETALDEFVAIAIIYGVAINAPLFLASALRLTNFLKFRLALMEFRKLQKAALVANSIYLVKRGSSFFTNQVLYISLLQVNPLFISLLYGSREVVEYTSYSAIFLLAVLVMNVLGNPIWSRVTRAKSERDSTWLKRALSFMLLLCIALFVVQICFAIYFEPIALFWFSGNSPIEGNQTIKWIFVVYAGSLIFHSAASTFACAFEELKLQRLFYLLIIIYKSLFVLFFWEENHQLWAYFLIGDFILLFVYSAVQVKTIFNYLSKPAALR